MNHSKKIILSILVVGFATIAYLGLQRGDIGTSVVNVGNKEYYQSSDGEFWVNQKNYDDYEEEEYYQAPDGTYWTNEYRYESSKG